MLSAKTQSLILIIRSRPVILCHLVNSRCKANELEKSKRQTWQLRGRAMPLEGVSESWRNRHESLFLPGWRITFVFITKVPRAQYRRCMPRFCHRVITIRIFGMLGERNCFPMASVVRKCVRLWIKNLLFFVFFQFYRKLSVKRKQLSKDV